MDKVTSGKRNGGNIMVHLVKRRNGLISGAVLIQPQTLRLVMLMFGMKGDGKNSAHHNNLKFASFFLLLKHHF
jgi:hypothetical protein